MSKAHQLGYPKIVLDHVHMHMCVCVCVRVCMCVCVCVCVCNIYVCVCTTELDTQGNFIACNSCNKVVSALAVAESLHPCYNLVTTVASNKVTWCIKALSTHCIGGTVRTSNWNKVPAGIC